MDISDLGFIYFYVKKSKPVAVFAIQEHCVHKLGKIRSEPKPFVWCLLLIFKVVYQDHLTQLLPIALGFCRERAAAGLGPSRLTSFVCSLLRQCNF